MESKSPLGTAIQNNYTEFWTMLDWANPEALGTLKEWTKYVSKPLATGQSKNSKDVERIKAKVGPTFSRGRRVYVIQLPTESRHHPQGQPASSVFQAPVRLVSNYASSS